MTTHRLDPALDTVTDVFDPSRPPVLTVDPGDTLVVRSLDASGNLQRHGAPGVPVEPLLESKRGHCLTGPVEVRGARPGQVLAVHLDELVPGDWGWTVAAVRDVPLNRRLGLVPGPRADLLWDLDGTTATDQHGHVVRLRPFLGVVGLPPAEPGEHSTIPPRVEGGGNIDCRELVAGSTLYLPVTVPGAMLCLGDGHGAQGDGEVSGTAVECPMTTTLRVELLDDAPLGTIHATTPAGRVTFGFDADLDEAMAQALDAMLTWMAQLFDLDRATAAALASPTVDLRVTQVANDVWGVHAVLPHDAVTGRVAR